MSTNPHDGSQPTTSPPEVRRQGVTRAGQWERWTPLAGIIFVVLMFTGTFFVAYPIPAANAPQQQIADYLTDSGTHTRNIIGAYIWVVGALAFLLFVIPFRFVDGIIKAWQRYSTLRLSPKMSTTSRSWKSTIATLTSSSA